MIRLMVNGKCTELVAPIALSKFMQSLGIRSQFVAVAYNGEVIDKKDFGRIVLYEGDVLEIVRPVGGG